MGTSGEKVRILDEAERVQSVSYSHMRSLSGLYAVVCLRESKRGTCIGWPPFATVMCKVAYLAFKGAQQQLQYIIGLLCFQWGRNSSFLQFASRNDSLSVSQADRQCCQMVVT